MISVFWGEDFKRNISKWMHQVTIVPESLKCSVLISCLIQYSIQSGLEYKFFVECNNFDIMYFNLL